MTPDPPGRSLGDQLEHAAHVDPGHAVHTEPIGTVHAEPIGTVHTEPTGAVHAEPIGTVHAEPIGTVHTEPIGTVHTELIGTVHTVPTGAVHTELIGTVHTVRVVLPAFLRTLGGITPGPTVSVTGEISLAISGDVTTETVLDALEEEFPALRGTVRDRATSARRPFIRFFACGDDLSHDPLDCPLPEAVASGREPFVVLGAIAGG